MQTQLVNMWKNEKERNTVQVVTELPLVYRIYAKCIWCKMSI